MQQYLITVRLRRGLTQRFVTIPRFSTTYHEVTKMGFHKILSVRPTEHYDFVFISCTGSLEEMGQFFRQKIKKIDLR